MCESTLTWYASKQSSFYPFSSSWELREVVVFHSMTKQDLAISLSVNQLGVLTALPCEINVGCSSLKWILLHVA